MMRRNVYGTNKLKSLCICRIVDGFEKCSLQHTNLVLMYVSVLQDSISALIAKYIGNGYMDYLQGKWYGQMPCFITGQQLGARVRIIFVFKSPIYFEAVL